MASIHLDTELIKRLQAAAQERSMSVEASLDEAVRAYLRQLEAEEMKKNIAVFEAKHSELLRNYSGWFVAIHAEKVVDKDEDYLKLHRRIRQRYGYQPVLIRQVLSESERTWIFHSPTTDLTSK
jgi:predicted transcriptional regulator